MDSNMNQDMDIGSSSGPDPSIAAATQTNVSATVATATSLNIVDFGDVDCCICLSLMIDPVETNCNHRSCRFCLEWTCQPGRIKSCPVCRTQLTKVLPLTPLNDFIKEFLVERLDFGAKKERNESMMEWKQKNRDWKIYLGKLGVEDLDPFKVLLVPNPTPEQSGIKLLVEMGLPGIRSRAMRSRRMRLRVGLAMLLFMGPGRVFR